MYQIKRNHITEDLQVEDNGKTLDLHVDLSVDGIVKGYLAAAKDLTQAQADLRKGETEERYEALGRAIVELFNVIFGEEQTVQLVNFYGDGYTEMLADVIPFINEIVVPKIVEAQQRIMGSYKNIKKFKR